MCRVYPTSRMGTAAAGRAASIAPRCRDWGRLFFRQIRWAWVLLGLLAWSLPAGCRVAGAVEPIPATTQSIRLGESEIAVVTTRIAGVRYLYVNLHDDENTSVDAVRGALGKSGGRLVELSHGGRRNLDFTVAGERYGVDPNRIFTAAGVRATLEKQSRYTAEAARAVARFAGELVKVYQIDRADAVIALHNNTPGMYSALSYATGGAYAGDAEDVFIRKDSDPDDFFFVTERRVFDALKRRGDNVVLQDNRRVTDDGSLSVYCGKANVRYINVEAEHGHLKEQARMIVDLTAVLNDVGLPRAN